MQTPETGAEGEVAAQEPEQKTMPEAQEDVIAGLEARLNEANDQFLRKAADFENYRKRMVREKQEAVEYANQSLLLDLIDIIDDFERAIKAGEPDSTGAADQPSILVFKTFYEGVSMIEKRFTSLLENKWGLKRFDSLGQPFDPNRHEAIMMDKSPEIDEPVVSEEFYKGYLLKDRVVRSAKVKVLMPVPKVQPSATTVAPTDNAENENTATGNK